MTQTLFIFLNLIIIIVSLTQVINGLTMDMIPIDSPNLGILPHNFTTRERHQYLANISLSRAYRFQRNNSRLNPNFEAPLIEVHDSYFVTSLQIGTGQQAHLTYVLLDTGEVMTWVQCEGCDPCFELKNKNFDYKKSATYKRMGRTDRLCPDHVYMGSCGFKAMYTDSSAEGLVGRDDFYFKNSVSGQMEVYKSLAFGCGLENRGMELGGNAGPDNIIAGIHGLAPGKISFINQLDDQIKGRFSYCIPKITPGLFKKSTMYFGDDAQISGDDTRHVQTISMNSAFRYHLYLNGISVDGIRLPINPSVFELDPVTFRKGFIIDTGSPHTVLVASAHDTFVDAIGKYMEEKNGLKSLPPEDGYHLCYEGNYHKDAPEIPSVIFHFARNEEASEVDMILDKGTLFGQFDVPEVFCLMVESNDEPGISVLGAFHQANIKFLYDIYNDLLHFIPENCQES